MQCNIFVVFTPIFVLICGMSNLFETETHKHKVTVFKIDRNFYIFIVEQTFFQSDDRC